MQMHKPPGLLGTTSTLWYNKRQCLPVRPLTMCVFKSLVMCVDTQHSPMPSSHQASVPMARVHRNGTSAY
jgi:hypothetical protein